MINTSYKGVFTQTTTKSILSIAERDLESSGEESGVKKKVFNVVVEVLQNIVKHCDSKHYAFFMLGKTENQYSIMSGNPMRNENIPSLRASLAQINSLDKEGLRELYKGIIKSTTITEKGGAGLGFVDMARKSGEKFEWSFVDVGEGFSFFHVKVNILRAKK